MSIKVSIAVVDDDQAFREALAGLLQSLGYCTVTFTSPKEFLNSDLRHDVACLISDVQMPGMTGAELHAQLIASGEAIPTILITAYPDEATRARVLEAGVMCYLPKPFKEDELLKCIRSALDCRSER